MSWRVDLQCTESRCVGRNMTRRHQFRLLLMIGLVSRLTHSGKSGGEEVGDNAPQTLELTAFNRTWSDAGEQGARARDWGPQEPRRSSWALAERAPQWPRCCENGGTCVLGSFCVCPAHFTGRHCEHDQRHSDCGALGHGAWTVRGCRLCRCVFGSLHCLRRQTLGRCDLKDFVPAHAAGQRAHLLLLLLCLFLQSLIRCL